MKFRTLLTALFLAAISHVAEAGTDGDRSVYVSVPDQRLILTENGKTVAKYPISTSRFGLGDSWSSYRTPLGALQVAQKIGANAQAGAVFHHRQATGEILQPDAGGRDPIVTRIIWLAGMEASNQNAYQRGIYIHGTPVEKLIGRPASYGCIRMRSQDVIALYSAIQVGTRVTVMNASLRQIVAQIRFKANAAPVMLAAAQPKKTLATSMQPAKAPSNAAKASVKLAVAPTTAKQHDRRIAAL